MTDKTFVYRNPKSALPRQVRYAVGQPMGFLSSWSAFSVTHHCLVRQAEMESNIPAGSSYIILGDDIVIFSRRVAITYRSYLDRLGIKISLNKSFYPSGVDGKSCGAEFAKRLISRDRYDVSPLPLRLLKRGRAGKLAFFNEVLARCNGVDKLSHRDFIPLLDRRDIITALLMFDDNSRTEMFLESVFKYAKGLDSTCRSLIPFGFPETVLVYPMIKLTVKYLRDYALKRISEVPYVTSYQQNMTSHALFVKKLRGLSRKPLARSPLLDPSSMFIHEMVGTSLFEAVASVTVMSTGPSPDDIRSSGLLNWCVSYASFRYVVEQVKPRPHLFYYLKKRRKAAIQLPSFSHFPVESLSDSELETIFRFRCSNPRISMT